MATVSVKLRSLLTLIKIFAFPILVFLLHLVFEVLNLYTAVSWLDIMMHLLGGVFIAYSFNLSLKYFQENQLIPQLHSLVRAAFLFSLVATAAVLWEFGEFTIDYLFRTSSQSGLQDTISDMFLGLVGGTVFILYVLSGMRRHKT